MQVKRSKMLLSWRTLTSGTLIVVAAKEELPSTEAEEVEVDAVDLLLDLEVEAQVDVLQPGQQVLVFVHEAPAGLDQTKLRVPLHRSTWT